jgi:hypothetical protein
VNRENREVGYHTRPARALAMAHAQALARALDHLQGTTTV